MKLFIQSCSGNKQIWYSTNEKLHLISPPFSLLLKCIDNKYTKLESMSNWKVTKKTKRNYFILKSRWNFDNYQRLTNRKLLDKWLLLNSNFHILANVFSFYFNVVWSYSEYLSHSLEKPSFSCPTKWLHNLFTFQNAALINLW